MALKSASRIQLAAARSDVFLAALPAARFSGRSVAAMRVTSPASSVLPMALSRVDLRKANRGRGMSVKVAAVNGPGLKVDLRGRRDVLPKVYKISSFLNQIHVSRRQEGVHRWRCRRPGAPLLAAIILITNRPGCNPRFFA